MTPTRTLAAALLAAALGIPAIAAAQSPYGPPPGYGPGPSYGQSYGPSYGPPPGRSMQPGGPPDAATVRQNLDALHNRLGLTGNQETAWQSFASAVTQQTQEMGALRNRMPGPDSNAPDRLNFMAQVMQQQATGMASVAKSLSALYAELRPEQRAIVDQEFAPRSGPPTAMR